MQLQRGFWGFSQAFGKKRERETAWNSRYSSRNPNCPPDIAVAHVLDPHDELEEIVQGLVLRELQRRGEGAMFLPGEGGLKSF